MSIKRIPEIMTVSLLLIGLLGACGSRNALDDSSVFMTEENEPSEIVQEETIQVETEQVESSQETKVSMNTENNSSLLVPQELKEIPEGYFQAADQQGTLVDLYYDTYESFSYTEKSQPLQKHAVVYLPYGYSKEQKYDVFYLMHGGWGDENMTLGTPKSPSSFKNIIDHAVAAGEMSPLIIVCPTYNNTNENGRDSANFSLAMQLTENYHNELINDLIPAVEATYSTYAASVNKDAMVASRDHRGFGGFSMGSVATWRTFQYGLDYFYYFLPMSCGTSLNDEGNICRGGRTRSR